MFDGGEFAFEINWQFRLQLVGGDADGICLGAQGVFDFHVVLLGAEDDADGRLVAGGAFFVVQKIQIEIHLARELRLEGADFEIECDERLEEAVVKEEVDEILLFPKRDAMLATDETKAVAEFEKEGLQARDEPVFEFPFLDRLAEAEKIQTVGAFEHLIRLLREVFRQSEIEVVRFLFRDGTFVGTGLDLIEQDITRPAEAGGGAEIPQPADGIGELVEDQQVLAPWNFRDKLSQNFNRGFSGHFGYRL